MFNDPSCGTGGFLPAATPAAPPAFDRQVRRLCRAFALTRAQAAAVAPLAFGGPRDD